MDILMMPILMIDAAIYYNGSMPELRLIDA